MSNINGGKMPVLVKAEKVQAEENNELLAENLNRRRQQLFRQEMGSRLKSKINATAGSLWPSQPLKAAGEMLVEQPCRGWHAAKERSHFDGGRRS